MLTERDLHQVKGLIHYLNETASPVGNGADVLAVDDFNLIDSNGEAVARVGWSDGVDAYVLVSTDAS